LKTFCIKTVQFLGLTHITIHLVCLFARDLIYIFWAFFDLWFFFKKKQEQQTTLLLQPAANYFYENERKFEYQTEMTYDTTLLLVHTHTH